jgi:hypothetical protein
MNENEPTSGPNFTKAGLGAMGDVNNVYDASQHTTNHSSSTSHTHHEDKSQHIDQSVTKQTTVHHNGLSPVVLFAVICVVIAGFLFFALALKPDSMTSSREKERVEERPAPAPAVLIKNEPVIQVTMLGASSTVIQPAMNAVSPAVLAPPGIVETEVGVIAGGQFTPRTSFKSGELLTLRLRVSRTCHVRVLYQPAEGAPMLMFPEIASGSASVQAGEDVFIPDPKMVAAKSPDATAFQLYHDTGSGPPITEQVIVQLADDPFTPEGAVEVAGAPRRTYTGLTLADARIRGAAKLKGLDAVAAQGRMEAALSQKTLPFTIQP